MPLLGVLVPPVAEVLVRVVDAVHNGSAWHGLVSYGLLD
jgi:hypothetical protein